MNARRITPKETPKGSASPADKRGMTTTSNPTQHREAFGFGFSTVNPTREQMDAITAANIAKALGR